MVHGSTLILAALAALSPGQPPPTAIIPDHAPVTAPVTPPVVVPSAHPPVIVPPEYHQFHIQTNPAPCCPPACGPLGCSFKEWNLAEKCEKLKRFLFYQSVYKMPCCTHECSPYRPPLYEWFPPCVGGVSHPMPCLQHEHCPSCKHPLLRFLGRPAGCTNCGTSPH